MAFVDKFDDGTNGQLLSDRPGWGILGAEGTRLFAVKSDLTSIGGATGGSGSGSTTYVCTDQGSADHDTILKWKAFSDTNYRGAARVQDEDNYIAVLLAGTGTSGLRILVVINGVDQTPLDQSQGAFGEWVKLECTGTDVSLYTGGTDVDPGTWVLRAGPFTVTDFQTATRQGLVNKGSSGATHYWLDEFRAESAGGPEPVKPNALFFSQDI